MVFSAFQMKLVSVRKNEIQGEHIIAYRPIAKAARSRRIAGNHSPQRSGGFRGIRRKKEGEGMRMPLEILAQGLQKNSGLNRNTAAVFRGLKIQNSIHALQVDGKAAFRDTAGGQAGSCALQCYRRIRGLLKNRNDVCFCFREKDSVGTSGFSGFILQIAVQKALFTGGFHKEGLLSSIFVKD